MDVHSATRVEYENSSMDDLLSIGRGPQIPHLHFFEAKLTKFFERCIRIFRDLLQDFNVVLWRVLESRIPCYNHFGFKDWQCFQSRPFFRAGGYARYSTP